MSNYLHLAKSDLKYANFGLTNCTDEVEINYAAYHVNQAIEKIIKALLELNGNDLTDRKYKTHNISYLISSLPKGTQVPNIIVERKFEIIRWVSEPRYNVNFRESKEDILIIYTATFEWLNQIMLMQSR
ncbi:HEPN domain-containing protein [Clostridium sp. CF011]|uniref:HEPN domain-containing protein n=1 Tax=Clostridium sp. CF011 TaxID=2843318 RepID=UPI001C0CFE36|nr:HEPN domain-containing protein [Clostridium sp. CF011]MBU3092986.1 HEPN domain-containing protein [Clostridium sp. CF011]WAG70931.1 HEPN domain-containing protein [Clostridium sp. CF011]